MKKEIKDKLDELIFRGHALAPTINRELAAWKLVKTLMGALEKVRKPAKTMGQIEEKYFANQIITNVTMKEAELTIENI